MDTVDPFVVSLLHFLLWWEIQSIIKRNFNFSAKKLDDSMDTAEPLSKKRRVSWIDERMRKPLHEVKYIAKENIGKKAAEAKGQKISKEILLASNSTKNRMRKFVYSCPPRKLQINYYV